MATEKKITKAMKFADVKAILNGETPVHGCSLDELIDFIDNEIALLAKKNAPNSKAKTKANAENEARKTAILEVLTAEPNRLFTATEIVAVLNDPVNMTSQRVSSLLTAMVAEGTVEKSTEKRKSYYRLAR